MKSLTYRHKKAILKLVVSKKGEFTVLNVLASAITTKACMLKCDKEQPELTFLAAK